MTWFFALTERAVGVDGSNESFDAFCGIAAVYRPSVALQRWVASRSAGLTERQMNAATDIARQRYETGLQSPSDITLQTFEALLPGSLALYGEGPNDLPLWSVMDGDRAACELFLNEILTLPPGMLTPSFEWRVQEVATALVAPAYRPSLDDPLLATDADVPHPVWLTHVAMRYSALHDPSELLDVPTIDDQIVAAIALWHLAMMKVEGPILFLEWLLVGLCSGVVAHHFSADIQQSLLAVVRDRAEQLDATLRTRLPTLPTFEERWTTRVNLMNR